MADSNSIPYDVVSKMRSRAITREQTTTIKRFRDAGLTRDDALLAVMGKTEAQIEIQSRYPSVVIIESVA